jgi:ectoine hydroxylase-related dioxygenase (phytanoyl-CoA dioxygenase family)
VRTELTLDLVESYRRDGFVAIEDFLDGDEIRELREAVDRAVKSLGRERVVGNPELAETEETRDPVVLQRVNLWKADVTVRRYVLDPQLGRMLCGLAAIPAIRIWHDQIFYKPPWGDATAFHLDLPNWSFSDPRAIQVWIALDDATVRNGCLHYLPGSHLITYADSTSRLRGELGAIFELYPELASVEAVPVEIPAGGAIVHSALVVHAAGANLTPRWRRAMTGQYMPDGAKFNGRPSILTRSQLASLEIGDVLDDDAHYAVVWRGDAPPLPSQPAT